MNPPRRNTAFSFAEIMIAAPWAYSIIANSQDNDKAIMLQRNTWPDEGLPPDPLTLEREARVQRASTLAAGLRRAADWLASAWRGRAPATAHRGS
jgi:hypothetical protein